MTIGKRIKNRRIELGLNADYLAEKLGVSRATIFRYEKGDIAKVPIDIISELSVILKTTPDILMGWNDKSTDIPILYHRLNKDRQLKVTKFVKEQFKQQIKNDAKQNKVKISKNSLGKFYKQ